MRSTPRHLLLVATSALIAVPAGATAQMVPVVHVDRAVTRTASFLRGGIHGVVTDELGHPLKAVAVSAQGSDLNFAMTDSSGRFAFRDLSPGTYWVRAQLSGYTRSPREVVMVRPAYETPLDIRLRRADEDADDEHGPTVVAAGFGAAEAQPAEPAVADEVSGGDTEAGSLAWRLKHLRRSVLREEGTRVIAEADRDSDLFLPAALYEVVETSARLAASLFVDSPLSGQVRLLTTGSFDSPAELFSGSAPAHSVAYFALQAPDGEWAVQGVMSPGDVSSWIVAGSYAVDVAPSHDVNVALSYGTQRYDGGNPAALAAVSDGRRNAGSVGASDRWTVGERLSVTYGAQYARYDYLEQQNLFSPSASVGVSPARGTWVRASLRQQMTAPGAEEFSPSAALNLFGPPERTFSPVGAAAVLRPERTRAASLSLERELGSFLVAVRRFEERVQDQPMTLFGRFDASGLRTDLGHYYIAGAGGLDIGGWSVELTRPVGSRVRGGMKYSVTDASFAASSRLDVRPRVALDRPSSTRAHDITGLIDTDVPETATRVTAAYRINTGFARLDETGLGLGLDGRFDVQVRQALPFLATRVGEWEVVVGVRNMFHDRGEGASHYDELLVVRPPKRVVGGVSVKF
jgi:hypothetical protein